MIKIVLAAVAATFSVSAHAAEPTVSESCGHFDNHSRFNPTELSEYQECWLDFHGKEAGMLGSLFYVKAGDTFVSMPVSELREAGSKAAAKAVVVEAIVERIVEVESGARIAALTAERNAAIADLATARDNFAARAAVIADLNDQIDILEAAAEAVRTASRDVGMTDLEILAHGESTGSNWKVNPPAAHSSAFDAETAGAGWETVTYLYISETARSAIRPVMSDDLAVINAAIDFAFSQGYDSGYDEGYANGYRDGFADGVASVQ